eukprot:COSAG04_NODE_8296_length_995_cov_0.901786_1_plen_38_part_10
MQVQKNVFVRGMKHMAESIEKKASEPERRLALAYTTRT